MAVRKLNLLILDDDASVVRLITKIVAAKLSDRLNIFQFTDPAEALEWIDNNCCDILLSDIEMPDYDGLEILRRAKHRNAWTQAIFLTAHSSWERISEAIENGASDYLLKPVDREEVQQLLDQLCARFARWHTAVFETFTQAKEQVPV